MQYRLYQMAAAEIVECETETDAAAIAYARALNVQQDIEIWQGPRIVAYLEQDALAARSAARVPRIERYSYLSMLARPKHFWTPERIAELTKLVEDGASLNRVAIRLKWSEKAVKRKETELGLVFKDPTGMRDLGTG